MKEGTEPCKVVSEQQRWVKDKQQKSACICQAFGYQTAHHSNVG